MTTMSLVYYPSCRFTEFSPVASEKLVAYMSERFGAEIAGCCRPHHSHLTSGDMVVTVCNTCQAIAAEDSPARVMSVWELIARDDQFVFPDLTGSRMTLQDCWRSRGCHAQHDAVRAVLRKMNVEIVELDARRDEADFCGVTLYQPLPPENARFAPHRFCEEAEGVFISHDDERISELMHKHCEDIKTDAVICYCVPCAKGIRLGGKRGIHLADLLFDVEG